MVLSTSTLFAQSLDTISLRSNGFYRSIEQELTQTPLLYTSLNLADYTQTQLDLQTEDLAFKRVQTAEKKQQYNFSTQGIFNIDPSLRLFGAIRFSKTEEENLGYTLSSERTQYQEVLTPNYFIAPQKGNWTNQHYHLQAGATKTIRNRYLLGATIHYTNEKFIRTVDPRPQITSHDLGGKLHAGYQLNQHRVYGYAGLQQKTETGSISYVNQWLNAPVYPATYTRFSSGYGRLLYSNTYSSHIFRTLYQQLGLGYQYQKDNQIINANYYYQKSMKDLYARNVNGNVFIDKNLITHKYRTLTYGANVNYIRLQNQWSYKAQLRLKTVTGDNFSVIEQGRNYHSTQDQIGATFGFLKRADQQRIAIRAEIYTDYHQNRYTDLLGFTDKKINSLLTGCVIGSDLYRKGAHRLYVETDWAFYQALDEGLIYNATSSASYFDQGVLYPDHAYDVSSRLQGGLQANYFVQLSNQRELGLFARYYGQTAVSDDYKKYDSTLSISHNTTFVVGLTIAY